MLAIIAMNAHIKNYVLKDKDRREFREPINPAVEEAKFFFYSDFGQEYYSHRAHYAETPFAIQFESRNFRGLKKSWIKKSKQRND